MQKPLVSILTPFKNTEPFLADCIQSVLQQTYTNWELIIVNDHSTDASWSIVANYAKNDNRIKLLTNTGNGIIDALKLAYKNSLGTFITRMDSDDIMHPEKLETLLKLLQQNGKNHVAIGQVKYFSERGISNGYTRYQTWLNGLTNTGSNYTEIYKECVIPSPCWMLHRDDLDACDAFNPNRYPEDYDLTFRFYKHNYKCIPCNKIIHYWRDYSSRTSRTHEHYAQNYFLDIKMHYFLKLDYNKNKTLTIWGAGNKGKTIAKKLIKNNIPFYWICNNPKKIGKHIYKQELRNFKFLKQLPNTQCIITVANQDSQTEILNYFKKLNCKNMLDYFFFC